MKLGHMTTTSETSIRAFLIYMYKFTCTNAIERLIFDDPFPYFRVFIGAPEVGLYCKFEIHVHIHVAETIMNSLIFTSNVHVSCSLKVLGFNIFFEKVFIIQHYMHALQ